MPIRIGINGFGRIGRLVYRIAAQRGNFEIVGVNDLVPADNLAYLLQHDSSHGRFAHEVKAGGDGFTAGPQKTRTMSEKEPAKLPWKDLGAQYVLESTGRFTEFEGARQHLDGGAKRVLISAPTKSDAEGPTLVYKGNHEKYDAARHTASLFASKASHSLARAAAEAVRFSAATAASASICALTAISAAW